MLQCFYPRFEIQTNAEEQTVAPTDFTTNKMMNYAQDLQDEAVGSSRTPVPGPAASGCMNPQGSCTMTCCVGLKDPTRTCRRL